MVRRAAFSRVLLGFFGRLHRILERFRRVWPNFRVAVAGSCPEMDQEKQACGRAQVTSTVSPKLPEPKEISWEFKG